MSSSYEGSLVLWVTYINIVLYALCYQLQRPVEPFLVQQLSDSADDANEVAKNYGQLQSFFSIVQTIGSPIVGILLDRIGIRLASAIVFSASALSYAILAVASDMNLLFCSKIPTALQAAFLVAQAVAATSTAGSESARAQALGRMTTAYTIGATLGPALGGYLASTGDLYIGAKLAVLGSLVSVVLSLQFYPSQPRLSESSKGGGVVEKNRSFMQELKHASAIAVRPVLWPLLSVKVMGGVTSSMHSTALPMVLTQDLKFDPASLGMTYSANSAAVALFGVIGMAPLTRALGASIMTWMGLFTRAILGFAIALVVSTAYVSTEPVMLQLVLVSVLHGLASHALATGLTTQTTGAVDKQEQGALLGLEHAFFSLARIGGPALGTALLVSGGTHQYDTGFRLVAAVCGCIDVAFVGLLIVTTSKNKAQKGKST
jgi:MFS family permease